MSNTTIDKAVPRMLIGHEKISVILGFRGVGGISLSGSCDEMPTVLQTHLALDSLASIHMCTSP